MLKQIHWSICVIALVGIGGCQKSSVWDRIPLSGTAQVDGAPFEGGSICFRPARGNKGPTAKTKVTDGKFKFDKHSGPVQGAHNVILFPTPDPNDRSYNRMDTKATVPSEEPFTLALEFTRPVVEPEPMLPADGPVEGAVPK